MNSDDFKIDSRLVGDTHHLFTWQGIHVLLHINATLPWVILVPETRAIELHDLDPDTQSKILKLSQIIGNHFKAQLQVEKINFAAIGNVVQQLHVHVIGRHSEDPLWPDVVWGQELQKNHYDRTAINAMADFIIDAINSTPSVTPS